MDWISEHGLVFGRPWFDAALLLYLVALFILEAVLIDRERPGGVSGFLLCFGCAAAAKKWWLALTFLYSLLFVHPPPPQTIDVWGRSVRVGLLLVATWEVGLLIRAKRRKRREKQAAVLLRA
jgi:hypothetical protein